MLVDELGERLDLFLYLSAVRQDAFQHDPALLFLDAFLVLNYDVLLGFMH